MNNAVRSRPGHAVKRRAIAAALLPMALGLAACGPGTGAAAPSGSVSPSVPPLAASATTSATASATAAESPARSSGKPSSTTASNKTATKKRATKKPAAKKPATKRPSSLQASAASRRRLVASCLATSKGLNEAVKTWNDAVSGGSQARLDSAARLLRSTAETVGKRGQHTGDASFERLSKQVANDLDVMAIRHDRGEDVYGGTLTKHSKQLRAYCAKKL